MKCLGIVLPFVFIIGTANTFAATFTDPTGDVTVNGSSTGTTITDFFNQCSFIDIKDVSLNITDTSIDVAITMQNIPDQLPYNQTNVTEGKIEYQIGLRFDVNQNGNYDNDEVGLALTSSKYKNTLQSNGQFNDFLQPMYAIGQTGKLSIIGNSPDRGLSEIKFHVNGNVISYSIPKKVTLLDSTQISFDGVNSQTPFGLGTSYRAASGTVDSIANKICTDFYSKNSNNSPTVSQVQVIGTPQVGQILAGSYVYSDADSDPEGISTFQWYRANDATGTNKIAINGAISKAYTLTDADLGKYISFAITPIAAKGSLFGTTATSSFIGAVTMSNILPVSDYCQLNPNYSPCKIVNYCQENTTASSCNNHFTNTINGPALIASIDMSSNVDINKPQQVASIIGLNTLFEIYGQGLNSGTTLTVEDCPNMQVLSSGSSTKYQFYCTQQGLPNIKKAIIYNSTGTPVYSFNVNATFDCLAVTEISTQECKALISLYDSANGKYWLNANKWLKDISPCFWNGVTCNNGHVTNLLLGNNNLSGNLPDLCSLTELETLDLSNNNLSGSFSTCLSKLKSANIFGTKISQIFADVCKWTPTLEVCQFNNTEAMAKAINTCQQMPSLPVCQEKVKIVSDSAGNPKLVISKTPTPSNPRVIDYVGLPVSFTAEGVELNDGLQMTVTDCLNSRLLPNGTLLQREFYCEQQGVPEIKQGTFKKADSSLLYNFEVDTQFLCEIVTTIPLSECKVLFDLYKDTNGRNWKNSLTNNWLKNLSPCGWTGITCGNGHITSLSLPNNNLSGVISGICNGLSQLQSLDLSGNNVTGDLSCGAVKIVTPLQDVNVIEGDTSQTIDLSKYFADSFEESSKLTFSIADNSSLRVVTPEINASNLTLIFKNTGTSYLTLNAVNSNGKSVSTIIKVTVQEKANSGQQTTTPTIEEPQLIIGVGGFSLPESTNLSNVKVAGVVKNSGQLSDVTVALLSHLNGGIISGKVLNGGIISDVQFNGVELQGGFLKGQIVNTNPNGVIKDVTLGEGITQKITNFMLDGSNTETVLSGGVVAGTIIGGSCSSPPILKNVYIADNTVLKCVILGEGVSIGNNVQIEFGEPRLPQLVEIEKNTGVNGCTSLGSQLYVDEATCKDDPITNMSKCKFHVFNRSDADAALVIRDAQNQVVFFPILIEGKHPKNTIIEWYVDGFANIYSDIVEEYSLGDPCNRANSKKTEVEINVPIGGSISISRGDEYGIAANFFVMGLEALGTALDGSISVKISGEVLQLFTTLSKELVLDFSKQVASRGNYDSDWVKDQLPKLTQILYESLSKVVDRNPKLFDKIALKVTAGTMEEFIEATFLISRIKQISEKFVLMLNTAGQLLSLSKAVALYAKTWKPDIYIPVESISKIPEGFSSAKVGYLFDALEGGSLQNKSLSAMVKPLENDLGKEVNVYLVARVGSFWYFRDGTIWKLYEGGTFPILMRTAIYSGTTFSILENVDISNIQSDTAIYMGYGIDEADMLTNQRYQLIYQK